ncbi:heavy metal translocating P-type ATPase [bacterium]|nr:heavy metal translocating P-type ATPase [bacterium]
MSEKRNSIRRDYKINGMDCAEEVAALRSEFGRLPGVVDLSFDVLNGRMSVDFRPEDLSEAAIILAVNKAGLSAVPWLDDSKLPPPSTFSPQLIAVVVSGAMLVAAMSVHTYLEGWRSAFGFEDSDRSWLPQVFYLLAIVAGAWFVVPKAILSLRRFRLDMNVLMTVAVLGAVAIGQSPEAATVAFLFALSLWLESWSVGRARRAVAALMELSPEHALVISSDGREESMEALKVVVGSRIRVKPGDRFPLDGKILSGETTVNQAPITGESMPVAKKVDDEVFAGSINEDGAVDVVTTRAADQSAIAKIIALVADAQRSRSPSEQWVERFAQVYTPSVLVFALLVMFIPPMLGFGESAHWFYQGLVLLVIACPCALVISTPVSVVAALTAAASRGVLIKGGSFVELPAKLKAIAFDKTGTLTLGRPEVIEVVPTAGHSEDEVLATAAAIENQSDHPLARSIVRAARSRELAILESFDVQAIKGKGMTATVDGETVWLGSHRFLEERSQETPELHETAERLSGSGASVVVVGKDDHVCGLIAMADTLRPNAKSVLTELHSLGIRRLVLLTGDNAATGKAIASEVGVDEVRAELLPEDKVGEIERLVKEYGTVAMMGDGVNDAPALARSSLGIAMGAIGTDAAIEAADVALMGDDLSSLPWLIRHSRRTLRIIRQNVVFSLAIKIVFVILTLGGFASLWAAIAADTGASLLVVANGLRLLAQKAKA